MHNSRGFFLLWLTPKLFSFSYKLKIKIYIFLLFISTQSGAQTLGGNTAFNFVNLSASPLLTSLGGVNTSYTSNDIGLAFYNPALLKPTMHTQMYAAFNDFYTGIKTYHLSMGYYHPAINTSFAYGIHYINYGDIQQTDAAGNMLGNFRPADWVMQVSASHSYLQKWNVGTTIKFINSDYGPYKSNALAADIGLQYHDSSNLFSASVLVKNLGVQLKKYTNAMEEELPFDLIIGITKRLAKAPFGFSFTANNLNVFDIRYNDENFNSVNSFGQDRANKKYIFDKIFRHVILAGHIYIDSKIEFNIGYNHLRRQELGIGNSGNGLNGFSMGAGLLLNKMQIRFARTNYQNNTAFNQLGLNLQLNGYFGLGKFGEKIKW